MLPYTCRPLHLIYIDIHFAVGSVSSVQRLQQILYFQWVDDRTKDIDDKVVKVEKEKTFFSKWQQEKTYFNQTSVSMIV